MGFRVALWNPGASQVFKYTQRNGKEAREVLMRCGEIGIRQCVRVDGPTSSQDLMAFQANLLGFPQGRVDLSSITWEGTQNLLRAAGIRVGSIPMVEYRLEPSEDESCLEYISPDFTGGKPISVRGGESIPAKPGNFPLTILAAMFGNTGGIRLVHTGTPKAAAAAGMGGSNLAINAALILGSIASGLNLSLAEVVAQAIPFENNYGVKMVEVRDAQGNAAQMPVFGVSLTGGQEGITALNPFGIADNLFVPNLGVGRMVSRELLAPQDYEKIERSMLIVNLGEVPTSELSAGQGSTDVNAVWMSRFRDAEGTALHARKLRLGYQWVEALRTADIEGMKAAAKEYTDIRIALNSAYAAGQNELFTLARKHNLAVFICGAGGARLVPDREVAKPGTAVLIGAPEDIAGFQAEFKTSEETGRICLPLKVGEEVGITVPSSIDLKAPERVPVYDSEMLPVPLEGIA